jgi:hypothetical protein
LFDCRSRRIVESSAEHTNTVVDCAESSDQRLVMTAGLEGLRFWDEGLDPVRMDVPHQQELKRVLFSPDVLHIATMQVDGLFRVWKLPSGYDVSQTVNLPLDQFFRLDPSGDRVFNSSFNTSRSLRKAIVQPLPGSQTTTGRASGDWQVGGFLNAMALSENDPLAMANSGPISARIQGWKEIQPTSMEQGGFIEIRDKTGGTLAPAMVTATEPLDVEFHRDSKRLTVLCAGGQGLIVDTSVGEVVATFEQPDHAMLSTNIPRRIVYHQDGRHLGAAAYFPAQ